MKWKQVEIRFNRISDELNNPGVNLVTQPEFFRIVGYKLGSCWGRVDYKHNIFTLQYRNRTAKEVNNIIYHEIAHVLFKSNPHWWIEQFAVKMSGLKWADRYSEQYSKTSRDIPSRNKLLSMACRKSEKLR